MNNNEIMFGRFLYRHSNESKEDGITAYPLQTDLEEDYPENLSLEDYHSYRVLKEVSFFCENLKEHISNLGIASISCGFIAWAFKQDVYQKSHDMLLGGLLPQFFFSIVGVLLKKYDKKHASSPLITMCLSFIGLCISPLFYQIEKGSIEEGPILYILDGGESAVLTTVIGLFREYVLPAITNCIFKEDNDESLIPLNSMELNL